MLKHIVIVMAMLMASTALTTQQARIGNACVRKGHVVFSVDIAALHTTSIPTRLDHLDHLLLIAVLPVKVSHSLLASLVQFSHFDGCE
jgi:hypothetical protein